jgi:hypothetical protein
LAVRLAAGPSWMSAFSVMVTTLEPSGERVSPSRAWLLRTPATSVPELDRRGLYASGSVSSRTYPPEPDASRTNAGCPEAEAPSLVHSTLCLSGVHRMASGSTVLPPNGCPSVFASTVRPSTAGSRSAKPLPARGSRSL